MKPRRAAGSHSQTRLQSDLLRLDLDPLRPSLLRQNSVPPRRICGELAQRLQTPPRPQRGERGPGGEGAPRRVWGEPAKDGRRSVRSVPIITSVGCARRSTCSMTGTTKFIPWPHSDAIAAAYPPEVHHRLGIFERAGPPLRQPRRAAPGRLASTPALRGDHRGWKLARSSEIRGRSPPTPMPAARSIVRH